MSAQRTGHDPEHDVLRGWTLAAAREEAARLEAKANALTAYLARPRAGLTDVVRRNLEAERDGYEWSASGILARIAEHEGHIVKVRELPVPMSPRARRQREAR